MSAWLSVGITVILIVVVFLILNRTITVRTSQQTALDEIKREVGAIITELNATTERNIELIEDRISTLEKLLEQADRKVGALRRDLAAHEAAGSGSGVYDRLGRPSADAPRRSIPVERHPPTRPSDPPERDDPESDGPGDGSAVEQPRRVSSSSGELEPGASDSFFVSRSGRVRQEQLRVDPASARTTLRERVRGLYLQGLSLERIASIVGKTVGEVELIVSLEEGNER